MSNYVCYHLHSDYSLLDSCSKFSEYVDLAKAQGMKAIGTTEHGIPRGWVEKKQLADKACIKLLRGVELYMTPDISARVRNNYHVILIARNDDGFHELNRLIGLSTRDDHRYYDNRISFEEFLNISPNIIKISACIASPLAKLERSDPWYEQLVKHYDYLEVQPHHSQLQVEYNKRLMQLSRQFNKPLIAGTDTHASSKYKAECRSLIMAYKGQFYVDEESCDLSWKSYDELVDMFDEQGVLPRNQYMEAIENTNVMADSVDDFVLDTSKKFPVLYGSPEADEKKLAEVTWSKLDQKIADGVIPKEQEEAFRSACVEELEAFHKTGMSGFMLSMSEIVSWCRDSGKPVGPCRGSVGGSRVAFVTDIIDLNPETYNCVFSRFCNTDRKEDPDIDCDVMESDRPAIFRHIQDKFGEKYTARVASYGTIQDLAFIDDCGGGLAILWEREHHPENFKNGRLDTSGKKKSDVYDKKNPYHPLKLEKVKSEWRTDPEKTKEEYPGLFMYYDGIVGTYISQSVHPAGIIVSSEELDENWGVFNKDGERCLLIGMQECHDVHLLKDDLLILKTVQVINDCCKLAGFPYPRMHQINFKDPDVWDDLGNDQLGVFQFESQFAAESLAKFKPRSIEEITVMNAALRPSGASYRDDLIKRKVHKNPTPEIDAILKESFGQLVYQEQIIAFLQQICGLSASYADTVRRAIAKKKRDEIDKALPEIIEGYCARSSKPRDIAEEECKEYLKVIEDASAYSFGKNHSTGYSLLSYLCGYYKHYYPAEFIASYLKNAANDDDINTGRAMAKSRGIAITKPRFRQDNRTFYISEDGRSISDALSSIKGVGLKDAEALYALRDFSGRFVELLREMSLYSGGLNKTVVEKLIKIDYFHEFGCVKKLLDIYAVFQDKFKPTLAQASQEKVMMELISYESGDENMSIGFLADLFEPSANKWAGVKDDPIDIVRYECEIIGTPITLLPDSKGVYAVLEVDTNYSPKVKMMSLASGNVGTLKVLKKDFFKNELTPGMIFKLDKWEPRPAYGRPGVMDNWMVKYTVI